MRIGKKIQVRKSKTERRKMRKYKEEKCEKVVRK